MNGVFKELVNKLALEEHPRPYQDVGVNGEKISVTSRCRVDFFFVRTCWRTM